MKKMMNLCLMVVFTFFLIGCGASRHNVAFGSVLDTETNLTFSLGDHYLVFVEALGERFHIENPDEVEEGWAIGYDVDVDVGFFVTFYNGYAVMISATNWSEDIHRFAFHQLSFTMTEDDLNTRFSEYLNEGTGIYTMYYDAGGRDITQSEDWENWIYSTIVDINEGRITSIIIQTQDAIRRYEQV